MATNFRSIANRVSPDYLCVYTGCMDVDALNYNPSATLPGLCIVRIVGCMDTGAYDYWATANTPASCKYSGCLDSTRNNYNPTATVESGRCANTFMGCTNRAGLNFHPSFNREDGSCQIGGCMQEGDVNYASTATFEDETCAAAAARRRHLDSSGVGCLSPLVCPSPLPVVKVVVAHGVGVGG